MPLKVLVPITKNSVSTGSLTFYPTTCSTHHSSGAIILTEKEQSLPMDPDSTNLNKDDTKDNNENEEEEEEWDQSIALLDDTSKEFQTRLSSGTSSSSSSTTCCGNPATVQSFHEDQEIPSHMEMVDPDETAIESSPRVSTVSDTLHSSDCRTSSIPTRSAHHSDPLKTTQTAPSSSSSSHYGNAFMDTIRDQEKFVFESSLPSSIVSSSNMSYQVIYEKKYKPYVTFLLQQNHDRLTHLSFLFSRQNANDTLLTTAKPTHNEKNKYDRFAKYQDELLQVKDLLKRIQLNHHDGSFNQQDSAHIGNKFTTTTKTTETRHVVPMQYHPDCDHTVDNVSYTSDKSIHHSFQHNHDSPTMDLHANISPIEMTRSQHYVVNPSPSMILSIQKRNASNRTLRTFPTFQDKIQMQDSDASFPSPPTTCMISDSLHRKRMASTSGKKGMDLKKKTLHWSKEEDTYEKIWNQQEDHSMDDFDGTANSSMKNNINRLGTFRHVDDNDFISSDEEKQLHYDFQDDDDYDHTHYDHKMHRKHPPKDKQDEDDNDEICSESSMSKQLYSSSISSPHVTNTRTFELLHQEKGHSRRPITSPFGARSLDSSQSPICHRDSYSPAMDYAEKKNKSAKSFHRGIRGASRETESYPSQLNDSIESADCTVRPRKTRNQKILQINTRIENQEQRNHHALLYDDKTPANITLHKGACFRLNPLAVRRPQPHSKEKILGEEVSSKPSIAYRHHFDTLHTEELREKQRKFDMDMTDRRSLFLQFGTRTMERLIVAADWMNARDSGSKYHPRMDTDSSSDSDSDSMVPPTLAGNGTRSSSRKKVAILLSITMPQAMSLTLQMLARNGTVGRNHHASLPQKSTITPNINIMNNHSLPGGTLIVLRSKEDLLEWERILRERTSYSVLNHANLSATERRNVTRTATKCAGVHIVLTTYDCIKVREVALSVDEKGRALVTNKNVKATTAIRDMDHHPTDQDEWYSSRHSSSIPSSSMGGVDPSSTVQQARHHPQIQVLSVLHGMLWNRIIFLDVLGKQSYLTKPGCARSDSSIVLRGESRMILFLNVSLDTTTNSTTEPSRKNTGEARTNITKVPPSIPSNHRPDFTNEDKLKESRRQLVPLAKMMDISIDRAADKLVSQYMLDLRDVTDGM